MFSHSNEFQDIVAEQQRREEEKKERAEASRKRKQDQQQEKKRRKVSNELESTLTNSGSASSDRVSRAESKAYVLRTATPKAGY